MMRPILSLAVGILMVTVPVRSQDAQLGLPTAKEFFKTYDDGTQQLLSDLLDSVTPRTRQIATQLVGEFRTSELPDLLKEPVKQLALSLDWGQYKRPLLNQMILLSRVPDLVPEAYREFWMPIVFDALVYFLGNLPEDRLFELVWKLALLPSDAPRGEKIVAFTNKIPTFQKIAQIIARNQAIPLDVRESLQVLESNVSTMTQRELVTLITEAVGEERLREARLTFDDEILAEASIGAVIKVQYVPPGGTEPQDAVIKVIKPYARVYIPQEMKIIDRMTRYFEANSGHYGIQDIPVTAMFRDIGAALEREILVEKEKANLKQAADYYAENPLVHVPWTSPDFENVTLMELVDGHKITDAFAGDPEKRAIMARRLFDALTYDPLYGNQKVTLFHGDPHAGNVFHVTDHPEDPYQIALLDWGLMGSFSRKQREQLVQLFLGLDFRHVKRMVNNLAGVIEGDLPEDPGKRERLREIFEEVFAMENVKSDYEQIGRMLELLLTEGYQLDSQFTLFIKSQLTIAGILAELDPEFDQVAYAQKKLTSQVKSEIPKRLLLLPAWNYHGYKSMMSNEDVKDYLFR
ncbi:MAG: AarF/UbiB family protein [bacterium]|nr:AarF/UbiB family protein [bacterium]